MRFKRWTLPYLFVLVLLSFWQGTLGARSYSFPWHKLRSVTDINTLNFLRATDIIVQKGILKYSISEYRDLFYSISYEKPNSSKYKSGSESGYKWRSDAIRFKGVGGRDFRIYIREVTDNSDKDGDISYARVRIWVSWDILASVKFDSRRRVKSVKVSHYIGDKLEKILWFDSEARRTRVVYANRKRKSPKEVYRRYTDKELGRPVKEVLELAKKKPKVIIALMDSGVDYNHPSLAFRVPYPSESLKRKCESLRIYSNSIMQEIKNERRKAYLSSRKSKELEELEERVKICDTVINYHLYGGWDFQDNDSRPYDFSNSPINIFEQYDHGSHVAGICCGYDPKAGYCSGYDGIGILALRHPNEESQYGVAINAAHTYGARIVNFSMGTNDEDHWKSLKKAIRKHSDIMFVTSAGNDGKDNDWTDHYPSNFGLYFDNVIAVAALGKDKKLTSFSNYGDRTVHLAALGNDVHSSVPNCKSDYYSGTSMAAPQVSRTIARMILASPKKLSPNDITQILRRTVVKTEELKRKTIWGGYLDEAAAVKCAKHFLRSRRCS